MGSPYFSIVIPIYNVEKFIKKCVDSVLMQTYKDFEVILVDDGSLDRCKEICDEYKAADSRVRVIHKENGGLVSARKVGCKLCRGEYVLCLDGDDWVRDDYLEKIKYMIDETEADIICFGYIDIINEKEIIKQYSVKTGVYTRETIEKTLFPILIHGENAVYFPPAIWAKAFKRELYVPNQLAVDDKIKIGEDVACIVPCFYQAKKICIIPDCLYFYRHNEISMTKNKKPFPWEGPEYIAKHLEKHLDCNRFDFQQQIYRRMVHSLFAVSKSQFYRDENYKTIRKDIITQLDNPYYKDAIKRCEYKGSIKAIIMNWLLKYRWLFPIYVVCKMSK